MPPASGAVLTNLNGLVFNKGYVSGTVEGHPTDSVEFGALQNVRLTHNFTWADVYGPESLSLLGRGLERESLTGSFSRGVLTPEQFMMFMGGRLSYDAGTDRTSFVKLVNDEPKPFNLHFASGPSSPDMDLYLYRCTCPEWSLEANNRAWLMGAGNFECHGQAVEDGGKLFEFTKPGNLTNSS